MPVHLRRATILSLYMVDFFRTLSTLSKVQYAIRDATAQFIGLRTQLPIWMTVVGKVVGSICNSEGAANNHRMTSKVHPMSVRCRRINIELHYGGIRGPI